MPTSIRWPGGVVTAGGAPVRFVPPRARGEAGRPCYERRIAESGEVRDAPGQLARPLQRARLDRLAAGQGGHQRAARGDARRRRRGRGAPAQPRARRAHPFRRGRRGGGLELARAPRAHPRLRVEGALLAPPPRARGQGPLPRLRPLAPREDARPFRGHRREDRLRARGRPLRDASAGSAGGEGRRVPRRALRRPRALSLAAGHGADAGARHPGLVPRDRAGGLLRRRLALPRKPVR